MRFNFPSFKPYHLLWLLAVQLPFEIDRPLMQAGPIAFTNVEVTLLLVLVAASLAGWRYGFRWPPLSWRVLGVWFVVAMFVAAFSAETLNMNALRATFRTLTGIALAVAVPQLLTSRPQLRYTLIALLMGGSLSFLFGWLEVESGRAFATLNLFRESPSTAGPFVRLTGSFDYVNQTTMFAEALLPIAVSLYLLRKQRPLVASICLIFITIILSLSRAAWVTGAGILLLAFVWHRWTHRQGEWAWFVAISGFVLLFIVSVVRYPVFSLRMTTESDSAWYVIDIDAPELLTVRANDSAEIQVTIHNQCPRDFRSDAVVPINIGVRWLDGETQLGEQRQAIGRLMPNSAETYTFQLETPPKAGRFQLQWDLVEEEIAWFSDKTARLFTTNVTVEPASAQPSTATFSSPRPKPQPLPPDATRGTLWRVAFEMWRNQPLTGIGLDNFRLLYGERLGLERWNELLHTNNWYIETLVSFGLLGAVPFFLWLIVLLNDMRRMLAAHDHITWGVALALLTFYIHGLLDYFLIFNSTGLLFWLLVGCWLVLQNDCAESSEKLTAEMQRAQRSGVSQRAD